MRACNLDSRNQLLVRLSHAIAGGGGDPIHQLFQRQLAMMPQAGTTPRYGTLMFFA
jgi:hypothetical protein